MNSLLRIFAGMVLGAAAAPAGAEFHLWTISEAYSNADGSVQFIELTAVTGGQQFLAGHTLKVTRGDQTRTFTFPGNLPGDTAGRRMLLGTQALSDMGVIGLDYVLAPGPFLFPEGGTINFAESSDLWTYGALPSHPRMSMLRNGTTAVNSPMNFAGQSVSLFPQRSVQDLNGELKSDMIWWNMSTGQLYRMLMTGMSIAAEGLVYQEPDTRWRIVADADFNGDGISDLLWRNYATGAVYMMPFTSPGTPGGGAVVYQEPSTAWRVVASPDIDGDGKADLVWRNASTGQVYAMLFNGFTIRDQGMVYTEPSAAWHIVGAGDFAGSGRHNQLLWWNSATGQVVIGTINRQGGSFAGMQVSHVYQEPNTDWAIEAIGDFNGDARSDILWQNAETGQVYMMLMNGASIASQGMIHQEPNLAWIIRTTGDYDGNGTADVLWHNSVTGDVFMMLMNGMSIAGQGFVYREASELWRLMGPETYRTVPPPG